MLEVPPVPAAVEESCPDHQHWSTEASYLQQQVYELLSMWTHSAWINVKDWDAHGEGDQTNNTQHHPDDGHGAESLKVALIHFFDLLRADRATIMASEVTALCVDGVDVIAIRVDHAVEPLDMARTHRSTARGAGLRAAQIAAGELTELTWHTAPAFHPVQPRDRRTISPQAYAVRQLRSTGHR
jgi:hypothetical protein